jgi:hypothetical protein
VLPVPRGEDMRTGRGNPGWTLGVLSRVFRMQVHLGEVYSKPYHRSGAHPPLTDPATWEAAQGPDVSQAASPSACTPHGAGPLRRLSAQDVCARLEDALRWTYVACVLGSTPQGPARRRAPCTRTSSSLTCSLARGGFSPDAPRPPLASSRMLSFERMMLLTCSIPGRARRTSDRCNGSLTETGRGRARVFDGADTAP